MTVVLKAVYVLKEYSEMCGIFLGEVITPGVVVERIRVVGGNSDIVINRSSVWEGSLPLVNGGCMLHISLVCNVLVGCGAVREG